MSIESSPEILSELAPQGSRSDGINYQALDVYDPLNKLGRNLEAAKNIGKTAAVGLGAVALAGCSSDSENITINSSEAVRVGAGIVLGLFAAAKESRESLHPSNWWQIGTNFTAGLTAGYFGVDLVEGGKIAPKYIDVAAATTAVAYIAKTSDPARWFTDKTAEKLGHIQASRNEQALVREIEHLIRETKSSNIKRSQAARNQLASMGLDPHGNRLKQGLIRKR